MPSTPACFDARRGIIYNDPAQICSVRGNEELTYSLLKQIYGPRRAPQVWRAVEQMVVQAQAARRPQAHPPLTHQDAILITYADQVRQAGVTPLQSLEAFARQFLADVVSGLHLLPFYPYSSDDGFAVMDYRQVDPRFGGWEDVARLGESFRLMFDAVVNHVSAKSAWFQAFLAGQPPYRDYFITVEGEVDLSAVVRPRTSPLLTEFETALGRRRVWTTFSADQIDLNYHNPQVLLEMLDLLRFYSERGAQLIRLDAIAYLWKEIGTPCIHLPQTHAIVRLFRWFLDQVAPGTLLITETNVPHAENLSYFGNGYDEAHLVYNFALPPLTLYTFYEGDSRPLTRWAKGLTLPSQEVTFFNFLASHDGIGLNPIRDVLPQAEDVLVQRALAHGGFVSYKALPDGRQVPYELNINYFDALCNPDEDEDLRIRVARFLCAQAIMLALQGVPGVYFHSLFGSRGWPQGVQSSGQKRAINRQKLWREDLERELAVPGERRLIYEGYCRLLSARRRTPAFDPYGEQKVLDCGPALFAVLRCARRPGGNARALCLHNVRSTTHTLTWESLQQALRAVGVDDFLPQQELLSGCTYRPQAGQPLTLEPYGVAWLVEGAP